MSETNWRTKILIVGTVLGALTGLGAAYLFIQKSAGEDEPPRLTPGEGVKLGLMVLGLFRQVSQLSEGK
ncbi:MAG: hypothetical protein AB1345_08135 [Chloroflexota bacterium]